MNNLENITVLVTRPVPSGKILCESIHVLGGTPVYFPTIELMPLEYDLNKIRVHSYDWIIFVSREAVERVSPCLRELVGKARVATIGASTAYFLQKKGIEKIVYPTNEWTSEGLLALPDFKKIKGQKIVIIRGEGGREIMADTLTARGAIVDHLPVYRRVVPVYADMNHYRLLICQKKINIIVCTSGESLHNLIMILGMKNEPLLREVAILVVSQRLVALAKELGFKHVFVAENASHAAVIAALCFIKGNNYV